MSHPGWLLLILGLLLIVIGGAWLLAPSTTWLGRLPGDIVIERENVRIYLPITTCILLSLLVSALLWLVAYFTR